MLPATLSLVAFLRLPVDLDRIDLARARALSGRPVVASFVARKPFACPDWNLTTVGAQTRDDGAERIVILRGVRYDVKAGELVRVFGVLEVRDHGAAWMDGGWFVPAWTEIRVRESR
jgi:hypothetical protein